ncbi:MAG TPA: branched-chain-amino-acid transaminase [Phycisphaeraceae bacterium]|nr:branched-chain-amino-acid transaminase [Phycisphaeraceae bacterium]
MKIWINGEFFPKQDAKISVYDHGFLYGDGVFEGIRFYNKRIFKCKSHVDRLFQSAEKIHLKIPYTPEQITSIMRQCIEENSLTDGYIRLVVSRGDGNLGLHPFQCKIANVVCIADSIHLYPDELYETGLAVITAKRIRVDPRALDPAVKSLNYLNNILAKIEAIDAGVLEAIMLNSEGNVSECTGDNLFIITDGAVHTPPTSAGILHGVTRAFVLELCHKLGITAVERDMTIEEVRAADEVFLTGTAAEIIAVTKVDSTVIGSGKRGPVTAKLNQAFRDAVSENAPED